MDVVVSAVTPTLFDRLLTLPPSVVRPPSWADELLGVLASLMRLS